MRPELPGDVEFGVDLEGLSNVNGAVVLLRRVIELAVGGMASSRVVPGFGALLRAIMKRFEHHDVQRRLELLEERAHGCTHDVCADQHDIRTVRGVHAGASASDGMKSRSAPSS